VVPAIYCQGSHSLMITGIACVYRLSWPI